MPEETSVYISGPMRLIGPPDYNHDQFCSVETVLRDSGSWSRVFNPARNFNGDKTLDVATYMELDLRQVLSSDSIVFLPRWTESEGAVLEARVALITGKSFYCAYPDGDDWQFAEMTDQQVRGGIEEYERYAKGGPVAQVKTGLSYITSRYSGDPSAYGIPQVLPNFRDYTPGVDVPEVEHIPATVVHHDDSPRVASLKRAIDYISGDRNTSYGPPTQDFKRTAALWTAFGFRFVMHDGDEPQPIVSHHIANAMILLKQSRLAWQPEKADSWDDTSGYAGCGHECVVSESEECADEPLAAWEQELLSDQADDSHPSYASSQEASEALDALRRKLAGEDDAA